MTETDKNELYEDYLAWSGGADPELEEVDTYLEYALPTKFEPHMTEVRAFFHAMIF